MARLFRLALLILATTLFAACAEYPVANTVTRVEYGYVETLEVYRESDNLPVNVGTVLGGIAGGVIGHQIGSGRGNTAATVGGAIGGTLLGHEIEEKVAGSHYRVTVRLDSGATLLIEDNRDVDLRVGDRVRVENNRVRRA